MYAIVVIFILAATAVMILMGIVARTGDGSYDMSQLLLSTTEQSFSDSTTSSAFENQQQGAFDRRKMLEVSLENDCLKDVLNSLPIVSKQHRRHPKGLVRAHHYDAHNLDKWNADSRLDPFPASTLPQSNCTIWEVGAHKQAADSRAMFKQYPQCHFHAFEPVPAYHAELKKRWKHESRMTTHNYGMANQATTLHLASEALAGQSTFVQDADHKGSQSTIPLKIVAFETAFHDAGGYPTVLHMNCEGCEWDFLPQAASWLENVSVIQIGFHAYPFEALGERALQYCQIRKVLSRTHDLQPNVVPFGWERWIGKQSGST